MTRRGRYMFAVATGLDASDLAGQPGLDGNMLEIVEHAGLQAVVCDVDLDEFGADALKQNLERLDWVEKVARTHDDVVRVTAAHATVAPLRLVTVCLDDDSVVQRLQRWEQPLREALERVAGCREWSVKAYQVTEPVMAPATGDPGARTGTAYLQHKKEQSGRRLEADRVALDSAETVHAALAARSNASRLLAAQDPQLTGRTERMLVNGAYLVPDAREDSFRNLVEELRARHTAVLLEVAGPWAPYSFAVLETSDDR